MLEIIEAFLEEESIFLKIISVTIAVIFVIADWRIHVKAGEKGWIALIPIYNVYSLYKIVWKASAFWYGVAINVAAVLMCFFEEFIQNDNIFIDIVMLLLTVLDVLYLVASNYKVSTAFGHKIGFTIGLTFLYGVFILIIAFGKSKYVRKNEKMNSEAKTESAV